MSGVATMQAVRRAFDGGDYSPVTELLRRAFGGALRKLPASEFSLLRAESDWWPAEHREEAFQAWCLDLWEGNAPVRKIDRMIRIASVGRFVAYGKVAAAHFLVQQRRVRLRTDPDSLAAINQAARVRTILRDQTGGFRTDQPDADNPMWRLVTQGSAPSLVSPAVLEAYARSLPDDEFGIRQLNPSVARAEPAAYDAGLMRLLERILERAGGAVAEQDLVRVTADRTGVTRTIESLDEVADLSGVEDDPAEAVIATDERERLACCVRVAIDILTDEDRTRMTVLADLTHADQPSGSRAGVIARAAASAGVAVNTMRGAIGRALATIDEQCDPATPDERRLAFQALLEALVAGKGTER